MTVAQIVVMHVLSHLLLAVLFQMPETASVPLMFLLPNLDTLSLTHYLLSLSLCPLASLSALQMLRPSLRRTAAQPPSRDYGHRGARR